jgi:predicted nuclease of restriction endonuclease-like (RecB) superfamily
MNNNMTSTDLKQAVLTIKTAILQSQSRAVRMVSGTQLSLYFGVGLYVSANSRRGTWGTGAIDAISEQLRRELPGLRGFSAQNIRNMRQFAEFWQPFLIHSPMASKLGIESLHAEIECDRLSLAKWSPLASEINRDEFLGISFSHHMEILHKTKNIDEVLLCIHETVVHQWDKYTLRSILKTGIPAPDGTAPNNFIQTIPSTRQAIKAIRMFKDEYLLDYINVEDIDAQEEDVDERLVEQRIVHNIKRFIMTLGRDFTFVGNQYHLEIYGEEMWSDLLFFNRELNALVAIELKIGKFKPAYLGQLQAYLQVLDDKVRKPHENPSIGIVLCKSANQAYAEYAVRDYNKPMGVATYKTIADMPKEMQHTLPDIEDLKKLMNDDEDTLTM